MYLIKVKFEMLYYKILFPELAYIINLNVLLDVTHFFVN
jgi:hypothetical protein